MNIVDKVRTWVLSSPSMPLPPPPPPLPVIEAPVAETPRADRPTMTVDSEGAAFALAALSRMGAASAHDVNVNPFDIKALKPPPGVGPKKGHALAMDAGGFGGVAAWAHEGLAGFLGPREGFIGFPELALMAQRPEYRSPVEIIATEATRKWIKFQASGDNKAEKIKKIEAEFSRLNVQGVFRQVSEHDGFYGRGHIYIEINGLIEGDELKTPIGIGDDEMSKLKIGKGSLKAIRTVEPVWVWPIAYNSIDPLSDQWYRPETWFCMSKEVHKTRLLTFISREVPDLLKPAYMFGGQSLTQLMMPVVENWLSTRKAVGEIVKKFSHNLIKINLAEALNSGNADKLMRRVVLFTQAKNNNGTMVLDKETEDFINISVPLGSLDLLQAQAQEHMCSLARIPQIKLLGIQPAGLNATSDGELRSFEENIHSYQESFFRPNLTTILNLVQCSLFGEVDPEIGFEFEPLTEALTDGERASAAQQVVAAMTNAFESGLIGRADALKTLRSLGEGLGLPIDDAMIAEAENEPPTPSPEELKAEAAMVKAESDLTH